jgi:hypothetical protein
MREIPETPVCCEGQKAHQKPCQLIIIIAHHSFAPLATFNILYNWAFCVFLLAQPVVSVSHISK